MILHTADRVRELNDAFRAAGPTGGDWIISNGVQKFGPDFVAEAIQQVRSFEAFDASNDPLGAHDFGAFSLRDELLLWTVECRDQALIQFSSKPSDPQITRRVLFLTHADER